MIHWMTDRARRMEIRLLCIALIVTGTVSGCSGGTPPTLNASRPDAPIVQDSDSYLIGSGDVLRIFVLGNPDLGAEIPVRPDGKISTPLVTDLVAAGKTTAELSKDIQTQLAEFVRNPNVSVIVSKPTSSFSQVKVIGQAVTPRAIPYRGGMTVMDVIIEVGGLSQFAAGNRARIIRSSSGQPKEMKVRLSDLINAGDISQNLAMEPGDVLVIPEARF
jgi:polysaccharide biosynthesis/export protein